MEEYDKRVTAMYNDCWKLYRDYTKSHDMRQFNEAKDAVIEKYGRQCDVIDLVLWIAIRVQTLHDMWEREKKNAGLPARHPSVSFGGWIWQPVSTPPAGAGLFQKGGIPASGQ